LPGGFTVDFLASAVIFLGASLFFSLRSGAGAGLTLFVAVPILLYCAVGAVSARGCARIAARIVPSGSAAGAAAEVFSLVVVLGLLFVLMVLPVAGFYFRNMGEADACAAYGVFMINLVLLQAVALSRNLRQFAASLLSRPRPPRG